MSEEKSDPKVRFLSITLAVVLTLFWAFLIAGTWYFFKIKGNAFEGTTLNWVARFHVIAVHMPIGMIFLVLLLELFGRMPGFANLRSSVSFVLWITLIGAIGASLLGFLLMEVEEYTIRPITSPNALTLHLWTGLVVVVLILLTLIFKLKEVRVAYSVTLLITVLGVMIAGHYGGSSVHGNDYLAEDAPKPLKLLMRGGLPKKERPQTTSQITPATKNIDNALVYRDLVAPILEKTCNRCHNEEDDDGELRMETLALIMKGGESEYPTIVPGNAEESEMIVRVMLERDHEEFMPTKGDPLTKDEVELLKLWINAGAAEKITVAELGDKPAVKSTIAEVRKVLAAHAAEVAAKPKQEKPAAAKGAKPE